MGYIYIHQDIPGHLYIKHSAESASIGEKENEGKTETFTLFLKQPHVSSKTGLMAGD